MKHKTADLEGAELDAAVAKAEGFSVDSVVIVPERPAPPGYRPNPYWVGENEPGPAECRVDGDPRWYSTAWDHGGPIIERERIEIQVSPITGLPWAAAVMRDHQPKTYIGNVMAGPTPLIAAMRAYVASKFGKEVDL